MPTLNTDGDTLLNQRSLVKVLTDWRSFIATIDGTQLEREEKPQLRLVGHRHNTYKYDAKGIYLWKSPNLWDSPNKVITETYQTIKRLFSRAQSTTVISPGEKFTPPTFRGLYLGNKRVGLRLDAEDPDMVSIKKIYSIDTGTVMAWHRNFPDPASAEIARNDLVLKNRLFSNLEEYITWAKSNTCLTMN